MVEKCKIMSKNHEMWFKGVNMNKVIINGKITNVKPFDKVIYATICSRTGKDYEFIPVTIFNIEFFKRYFYVGKWISLEGHIHVNKHNDEYNTEIIVDEMHFVGDANELDSKIAEIFKEPAPQ